MTGTTTFRIGWTDMRGKQPHSCPDCKCEPLCSECGGMGYVTTSESRPESRPGAMDGYGSIGSAPCPNGCPAPTFVL